MPRGGIHARVQGGAALGRVSAQLKAAGNKEVQKGMRKRLREAVKPVTEEIRRDAAEVSKQVAKSITASFSYTERSAGAKIEAKRSKMPPGKHGLPGLLEFGSHGNRSAIRHPVFGNRETWVNQPIRPYFYRNASRYSADVTRAMTKVLDDVEATLTRGL